MKRPFIFSVRSSFSSLLYHFSLYSLPLLLLYILLLILFLSLDSSFVMPNFLHISILFLPLPVLLIFFLFHYTLHILLLVLVVSLLPCYSITYTSFSLPLFISFLLLFPFSFHPILSHILPLIFHFSYYSSCSCCLSPPVLFCVLPLSLIRMCSKPTRNYWRPKKPEVHCHKRFSYWTCTQFCRNHSIVFTEHSAMQFRLHIRSNTPFAVKSKGGMK